MVKVTLPLIVTMLLLLALVTAAPVSVRPDTPSGQTPQVRLSPRAEEEIKQVEQHIDAIETAALADLGASPDHVRRIAFLGKLLLFDKELSVNRNEACAFCHMPETGFGAPVSELNKTTVS
jgi:cytochrome c peroxidase